jgi:histidinol-phosphate aminotransferase
MDVDVLTTILEAAPGVVVIDEAYQEFSSQPSALSQLTDWPRLMVVRTMSKAFAFAAARIGYVAAHKEVIDALRIVRLPYHLNSVTQALGCVALDFAEQMKSQVESLRQKRDQATGRLRAMGLSVIDSQANFFLFGPFANPHDTWQALVDRGILVRDTGVGNYLRVCMGTDEEMDGFFSGLEEVVAEERKRT